MGNSEHVKKEYPSLDGTTCNCRLACEVARSQAAELNAISEYLYQSIMFRETMPGLSDMFDGIALDEMHHFRMLGELINRLGGDPTVRTAVRGRGGICLREDKDSRAPVAAARTLGCNIAAERAAYNEYMRLASLAERMGQLPAAALLRRIACDERSHTERQEELLK